MKRVGITVVIIGILTLIATTLCYICTGLVYSDYADFSRKRYYEHVNANGDNNE